MVCLMLLTTHPLGMDSLLFVVILRRLVFVKSLLVDFLLSHVVVNNMVRVFHFAFVLVDRNAY